MSTFQKILNAVLVIAVVTIGYGSLVKSHSLGDSTVHNYPEWFYGGTSIGPANNIVAQVLDGSTTCGTGASTIAGLASTTVECAISNVNPGDKVFVSLASTTPVSIGQIGAFASTTSGFIDIILFNYATTTKAIAGATSSVQYLIVR